LTVKFFFLIPYPECSKIGPMLMTAATNSFPDMNF